MEELDESYLYDGMMAILDSGTSILNHLDELNGYLEKLRQELMSEGRSLAAQEYLRIAKSILPHISTIVGAQAAVVKKVFESEFDIEEVTEEEPVSIPVKLFNKAIGSAHIVDGAFGVLEIVLDEEVNALLRGQLTEYSISARYSGLSLIPEEIDLLPPTNDISNLKIGEPHE